MITTIDGRFACDLCGRAGLPRSCYVPLASGLVQLCRSCVRSYRGAGEMSAGGHTVRFAQDHARWRCDCGAAFRAPARVPQRVLNAVPDIVGATARIHLARAASHDRHVFWSDAEAPG